MRLSNEASILDVIAAFDWVSGVVGHEFDAKTALQEPQFQRDRILALHFLNNFHLEWLFAAARECHRDTGELPRDIAFDPLYTFLVSVHRIFIHLPPSARNEFASKLKGLVSGKFGIRPFAYELSMATHLMSKGWDVVFADIEKIADFDFLAKKDGIEIEMECKTTSGDSGRQIHRHEMSRLSSLIGPALETLAAHAGSHFLKIVVPSKLESSEAALRRIAEAVTESARDRVDKTTPDAVVTYSYRPDLVWSGSGDDSAVSVVCEETLGVSGPHILFQGRPSFSVAIAVFASERPDTVVRTLTKRAKEASDQCSGTRPAIVTLNLVDPIGRSELERMLGSFNGLHAIAAGVFESEKRSHVDTMAFTVPQNVVVDPAGYTTLKGDVFTLFNPKPRYESPVVREVFKPVVREHRVPEEK
jgi:hypothetical protein